MNIKLIFASVLAVAALASCAHRDTTVHRTDIAPTPANMASASDERITDWHWRLDRAVDPAGVTDTRWLRPSNMPVTLTFGDQILSIAGLCNVMNAGYRVADDDIRIGQVTSTMRMCPDESLMRYEQALGQRLPMATNWHITQMPDQAGRPNLTIKFQDESQWVLTGVPTSAAKYGSPGEIMFLEVAPQTVACSDPLMPQRQCLNVRTVHYDAAGIKQGYGPWQLFYGHIEGFQHQPGMRNIVRVKRYTLQQPPADASQYAWVLDLVVESETVNTGY